MNLKKLFLMLTFFVLMGTTAFAQTQYYVDVVAGNDSWTGTASTFQSGNVGPKKTIQAMHDYSAIVTGDVINIAAGSYPESITLTKRVQLKPTGAVDVTNLTLNATGANSVANTLALGAAGQSLTINGTLYVQAGRYSLTTAQVILASGGTLQVGVGLTTTSGLASPISTTAGNFTLTFSNASALTYTPAELYNNNPGAINFNGSGAVSLGASVTGTGALTIASGASVLLGANNLTIGGNFTNHGVYSGTGYVEMTAAGTISGSDGQFMNLTLSTAGTKTLGSNITFYNVSQSTASLINITAGALALSTYELITPGNVTTFASAVAITEGTGGKLTFSGSTGTIGSVNFTLGAGMTLKNVKIDKPSGSTVNLVTNALVIDTKFEFIGGIFNINGNNLTLSDNHGTTASIGGNINGSGGTFTIGGGASVNAITISGAGQINTPFTVAMGGTTTATFTQLTTIGNNLTLTSGGLTTSSLQLINGTVTLTAGTLTFNTASLSVTSTFTMNGGTLAGSAPITVSGAFAKNAGAIVNTTGTITTASFTGAGAGAVTCAGLSTTGGGNIAFGTGAVTINGNLNSAGTVTTSNGNFSVTGSATSTGTWTVGTGAATGTFTIGTGLSTGAFSFGAGAATAVSITSGGFTVTGTANLTNGASVTVTAGNFTASGALTTAACAVTVTAGNLQGAGITLGTAAINVTGNVITTGATDLTAGTGGTGTLTASGTVTTGGNLVTNVMDMIFNGTGASSVGGKITSAAADADGADATYSLVISGNLTITGATNIGIQPLHATKYNFLGFVNMGSTNDFDATGEAGAFTADISGALTARDILADGTAATTINLKAPTTGVNTSQVRTVSDVPAGADAGVFTLSVQSTSSSIYSVLNVSQNITYTSAAASLLTVSANAKVAMNGSGSDLKTLYATKAQVIDVTGHNLLIANLEINNSNTDSAPTADNGGDGATLDETLEAVYITGGNTLTVTNLTLTQNGLNGTGLLIGTVVNTAGVGTITRSGGSLNVAFSTPGTQNHLVYNNTTNISTGLEFSTPAGGNAIGNLSLPTTGSGNVTLSANSGNISGTLTVAVGRTLALTDATPSDWTLAMVYGGATGTVATINGTITAATNSQFSFKATAGNNYTFTGTGTIQSLTLDANSQAGQLIMNGPSTILGNFSTINTGAAGSETLVYNAASTIGGAVSLDNPTQTISKALTVTGNFTKVTGALTAWDGTSTYYGLTVGGNFTNTAGNLTSGTILMNGAASKTFTQTNGAITIYGNLTTPGAYTQANGTLTMNSNGVGSIGGAMTWAQGALALSVTGDFTVNGDFTGFGSGAGSVVFPPVSTSSLILKGANVTMNATNETFTFNTGVGRVQFAGTAAQTLTIQTAAALTIPRVALNNSLGLTVNGTSATFAVSNLLLTAGTLTHNGLLTMNTGSDRIVRDGGLLASFAAAGPNQAEYISASGFTTGYETPSTINQVIVNATSGNPSYTLDKNVTILTGGALNLSRGTLVASPNSLIVQNACTITRAEGSITGNISYGSGETLQYFNTVADLTTGPEFTNDGSITTLTINAPTKQVILGSNVNVGGAVNLTFGTLNLNGFTFTESAAATITNNGNITGTGTLANTGAGSTYTGTATSWPNINDAGGLTINNTTAASDITLASLTIATGGTTTYGGNIASATINGNFALNGTGTYNDASIPTNFKGDFTVAGTATLTQGGLFTFNGTNAQTISSGTALNNVTFNNAAGFTLAADLTIANGSTLTFTNGMVSTGSNTLQVGTTATATVNRTAGGVYGNMVRWANSQPGVGVTVNNLFPMVTSNNVYRPATISFTGTAAGPQAQMIRVNHTDAMPTGLVGIPFTTGSITINKLSPMSWQVGMYDATNTTLLTPAVNPKVTLGVGGYTYGDITKIRAVYRLTNVNNTWLMPGTFDGSYYAIDGTATVIHSGVQGWALEAQQVFTVGYQSSFAIANAISDQTLNVGGAAYTKTVQTAPAVFTGAAGTLTYSVTSGTPAVATATVVGGVLTVTAVSAGTSVITLTATDINGETLSTTFNANVNSAPVLVSADGAAKTMGTGTTWVNTFTATGQGTIVISKVSGPAWGVFTVADGKLTLTPGFSDAGTGVFVMRATSSNTLTTDFTYTVTVTTVNQAPTVTPTVATQTINYGAASTVTFTGADVNADVLTFTLAPAVTPAYAGTITIANVVNAVTVTMTPATADIGKVFTVSVTANDGTVNSVAASTAVTVAADLVGTPPAARVKGDVDGLGGVPNSDDALPVLNYVVNPTVNTLTAAQLWAADVNGDGFVTAYDAASILYSSLYGTFLSKQVAAAGTASFGQFTFDNGVYTLPISLMNTAGVKSFYSEIQLGTTVDFKGLTSRLPEGWIVASNLENGTLKIAMAGITPLRDGQVALINLSLKDKDAKVNVQGSVTLNDAVNASLDAVQIREIPTEFSVSQNYPNPFNPTTNIKYGIPQNARVNLTVYNILGQAVRTLVNADQEAGNYTVIWDGKNDFGGQVSSGVYIYRISAGNFTHSVKMNLLK